MALKKSLRILLGAQLALALCLAVLTALLFQNQRTLSHLQQVHFRSYLLADELRQSSDDLTRLARAFAATGTEEFERQYWAVAGVRNGTIPRPVEYNRVYWDLVTSKEQKPRTDGPAISLHELMVREGFSDAELEKLSASQKYSDELVQTEKIAINAVKGLFDDGAGHFTLRKEPDRALAMKLMNDLAYNESKARIMRPIDDFYVLFAGRTASDVAKYEQRSTILLWFLSANIAAILGMFAFSFVILQQQLAKREHAEAAIRESEERYRMLADHTEDVVMLNDTRGNCLYVSPSFFRKTGWTMEDLMGTAGRIQVHPDDLAFVQATRTKNLAGESTVIEHRTSRSDGAWIWFETSCKPIAGPDGKVWRLLVWSHDITERRTAEQELRNRETFLRLAQEAAHVGSWEWDVATNGFNWSDELARIHGISSAEFDGRIETIMSFCHPQDRARLREKMDRMFDATNTDLSGFECRIVRRDRTERDLWFLGQVQRDGLGPPSKVLGIAIDITDRKRAEAELTASEERFRLSMEAARDGIWDWDIPSDDTYFSPNYYRMLGYENGEFPMKGDAWKKLLHPEDRQQALKANDDCIDGASAAFEVEFRMKTRNGDWRWILSRGNCVKRDEQGRGIRLLGTHVDITDLKRAQTALAEERNLLAQRVEARTAELSKLNAELGYAVRAKDEFLATMSHELRTPLNAILAFSESLLEQLPGPLNDRQKRSIGNIETSGRHLLSLINDILDLSKVDAGRMELHFENVQVADVCEASQMFVKSMAAKKNIKLEFTCNDPHAEVRADEIRLKQILMNLLSNAVKFTEPGGRVSLKVDTDPAAEVVRFAVRDTGIGIAPADFSRLFQRFSQVDSSLNRSHEGTGLGLLARRMTELHGGSITVESEVGKGSCFTVSIPRATRHATSVPAAPAADGSQSTAQASSSAAPQTRKARILLAEDNEFNIQAVAEYLEDKNFGVNIARNGQEAVNLAIENPPDLILMDIQMPVMDGLEAMRQLRARPEFASIPILALTALAMPGDRERCLAAGANEYLTKPVSLKGLLGAIGRLLRR